MRWYAESEKVWRDRPATLWNLSVWEPRFGGFTWGWEALLVLYQGPVKDCGSTSYHSIPLVRHMYYSTESSRGEKPSACFSVLGVASSSLSRTSNPNTSLWPPYLSICALVRSIVSGHPKREPRTPQICVKISWKPKFLHRIWEFEALIWFIVCRTLTGPHAISYKNSDEHALNLPSDRSPRSLHKCHDLFSSVLQVMFIFGHAIFYNVQSNLTFRVV